MWARTTSDDLVNLDKIESLCRVMGRVKAIPPGDENPYILFDGTEREGQLEMDKLRRWLVEGRPSAPSTT